MLSDAVLGSQPCQKAAAQWSFGFNFIIPIGDKFRRVNLKVFVLAPAILGNAVCLKTIFRRSLISIQISSEDISLAKCRHALLGRDQMITGHDADVMFELDIHWAGRTCRNRARWCQDFPD